MVSKDAGDGDRDDVIGTRIFIELSDALNEKLKRLAMYSRGDRAVVLKKAIALYQVAVDAADKNLKVALVDARGKVVEKIDAL